MGASESKPGWPRIHASLSMLMAPFFVSTHCRPATTRDGIESYGQLSPITEIALQNDRLAPARRAPLRRNRLDSSTPFRMLVGTVPVSARQIAALSRYFLGWEDKAFRRFWISPLLLRWSVSGRGRGLRRGMNLCTRALDRYRRLILFWCRTGIFSLVELGCISKVLEVKLRTIL